MRWAALFAFILFTGSLFGQKLSTEQLIDLWKQSDTSQTTKAEISYADLKVNKDFKVYKERLFELYSYLSKHNKPRLLIRTWIYEALGKAEFNMPFSESDKIHLQKAIKMAGLMEDNQLLSELFSLYERMSNDNSSYYALRSLQLQAAIGAEHFPLYYLRLINFSINMYNIGDYQSSIQYGRSALQLMEPLSGPDQIQRRVLQLDYLGACYKRLKQPDSVLFYYGKIQQLAPNLKDDRLRTIWTGIAEGGIGQALLLKQQYKEAEPYLQRNLSSSIHYQQWQDAAIAKAGIACVQIAAHNYQKALDGLHCALDWYGDDLFGKMEVTQLLGSLFQKTGNLDSAIHYLQLYHTYSMKISELRSQQKLESLRSRIEFNNMEAALQGARKDILEEKNIRFFILSAIALIAIIVILVYNRHRIKNSLMLEQASSRQKMAEMEARQAKDQIKFFTEKIKRSDALIEELRQNALTASAAHSAGLETTLQQYTLVTNEGWDNFRMEFIKGYPLFYPSLQKIAGVLTPAEERLAALIHLQLNNAQIATSLGIAKDSVSRSKRRLKQRLKLSDDISLEQFLLNLEHNTNSN